MNRMPLERASIARSTESSEGRAAKRVIADFVAEAILLPQHSA